MKVRVLYFGLLREMTGRDRDDLILAEGSTLGDLIRRCSERSSVIADHAEVLAYSVNLEYARDEHLVLHDGDEVAMLPPVSGGRPAPQRCQLVRVPILTQPLLDSVKHPQDGALSIFEGTVRDNTRGRATTHLIYEAYEQMAVKQMEALAVEAISKFGVRDVRIVHRLGRLEIGETSVVIVVASMHRAPAIDACRWLIDTLKKTVPVWKKEYFRDGSVWADGEPFPAELRPSGEANQ